MNGAADTGLDTIEWRIGDAPVDYPLAVATMEARADAIRVGAAREMVWLIEHPPLYTAGTSARADEVLDPRFPIYPSGRGGRHTYHGPGQRVGYLMIDLGSRGRDVRCFVHALEDWMAATLGLLGVACHTIPGRVGLWTHDDGEHAKIGAIGVRVKRWVTMHGFAINLAPQLSHFGGIVPCGLPDSRVTSLEKLGKAVDAATFDSALARGFPAFLGALTASRL